MQGYIVCVYIYIYICMYSWLFFMLSHKFLDVNIFHIIIIIKKKNLVVVNCQSKPIKTYYFIRINNPTFKIKKIYWIFLVKILFHTYTLHLIKQQVSTRFPIDQSFAFNYVDYFIVILWFSLLFHSNSLI